MTTPVVKLPNSFNATEVPVASITTDVAKITTSGSSSDAVLPTGATVGTLIRVAATQDCHIKFGSGATTATNTDTLFPAGVEIMQVPIGVDRIAAIQDTTAGVLTVTTMV